jgi:TolB protein
MGVSSPMTAWSRMASLLACVAFVAALWPPRADSQTKPGEEALPTRAVVVVDSPERALYRIAIPNLRGNATSGATGAEVVRNDLKLVSLFEILNPSSFLADPAKEGLGIDKAAWSAVGAQGVVKGELRPIAGGFECEMRFFEIARGTTPLLTRTYRGGADQLRGWMHDFANEILQLLTGKRGVFGTRLAFARRVGPGRKDIYVADFDGQNQARVSSGVGTAMLPSFGPGGVWYSILSATGMFITHTAAREKPVIGGNGLNMGVSLCGGRAYFSSTRDGNSEIYSASLTGGDVRRLTNHPAIDVSPTCGPGGQIAFVSSRHGGPQVFVMSISGGEPKRVTYKGEHNQTPSFCRDPSGPPLIAFSGRDGGGFDIFTVNLSTGAYTRLTQGQGVNQDPAFSADCRMIAFASSRGGIFISNPEGLNQNKVVSGTVSTVRWSR